MPIKHLSNYSRGRKPEYEAYHVWKAYELILKKGPIGRQALSNDLGIGIGSTRTILEKMMREGYAETSRRGTELTRAGVDYFSDLGITVERLEHGDEEGCCGALIRGRGGAARRLLNGPMSEIGTPHSGNLYVSVMEDGHLTSVVGALPETLLENALQIFSPEDEDVIIIGGGESYRSAEELVVTEALRFIDTTSPCWEGENGSSSEMVDLRCIALVIHELMGRLPVTMRFKNRLGLRIERGQIIEQDYSGPVLEEALEKESIVRRVAQSGVYRGVPIVVAPVLRKGEVIAVIGVVDITKGAIFDIMRRMRPG